MQLKLFIVPVKDLAAPEAEMNAFLRGHRVLAVKKEFVPDGENSFWTFCVEHLEGATSPVGLPGRGPKVDYREVLNESDFALFSKLRDWRKAVAEKEAIPVYAVLSNEQLAAIVQKKVSTKAALKEIEGVGEARLEKYSEALLQVLTRASTAATDKSPPTP